MAIAPLLILLACDADAGLLEVGWPPEETLTLAAAPGDVVDNTITYISPRVRNLDVVGSLRRSLYPRVLREIGPKRWVVLRLYIDEAGDAEEIVLAESSGTRSVDEAALRIAHAAEFKPALHHGVPKGTWWSWRVRWPLIVIDGVPRPEVTALADVAGFSIHDVESVEVLDGYDGVLDRYPEWGSDAILLITTIADSSRHRQ